MTSPMFGVVAGTLGLTSWIGFLFYGFASLFVSALLFGLLMRGEPGKYVQPAWSVWTLQVLAGVPSFLLTWTLFYGLVHVYD